MEVTGPGPLQGSAPINPARTTPEPSQQAPSGPTAPQDELDISPAGQALNDLSQNSDVRAERLAQIKTAIDAGEYETPEKLEMALDKLLDEIRADNSEDENRQLLSTKDSPARPVYDAIGGQRVGGLTISDAAQTA